MRLLLSNRQFHRCKTLRKLTLRFCNTVKEETNISRTAYVLPVRLVESSSAFVALCSWTHAVRRCFVDKSNSFGTKRTFKSWHVLHSNDSIYEANPIGCNAVTRSLTWILVVTSYFPMHRTGRRVTNRKILIPNRRMDDFYCSIISNQKERKYNYLLKKMTITILKA